MARPFLLAQVSDLHIATRGRLASGGVDTPGMVRACVVAPHTMYVGEFAAVR